MKRFDVVDRKFVRAYDVQKAYLLCNFPRKVVWILEYLSAYIELDTYIEWRDQYLLYVVYVLQSQEQEEKIPTTKKSMGNRKKLEAFKESVLKSIKLVFTFSAKLSCALVLASHHGGRVKYMYDFGYTFLDSFILWCPTPSRHQNSASKDRI